MSGCKWSLVLVGNVDKEEITAITAAADLYETRFCGAPLAPTGTMTVVAIQSPDPPYRFFSRASKDGGSVPSV